MRMVCQIVKGFLQVPEWSVALWKGVISLLLLVFMLHAPIISQSSDSSKGFITNALTFRVSNPDTTLQLPHQFLIENSDTIESDSLSLVRGVHYNLDNRRGTVTLIGKSFSAGGSQQSPYTIKIRYKALPFLFKEKYQHREMIIQKDSASESQPKKEITVTPFSFDDVLKSSNLQKSGSIVRGLTIGSNRDVTLNSGFRMQLSGNLTDDIEVIAALTDENTPIQPEGSTQTLQEFDKVFIELRSKDITATLGDFNLDVKGSEFSAFSRKLQGAKVEANYRTSFSNGNILASGATARGKYHTQSFTGVDGVQGPYRLLGKGGERDIIVIAGTERVYINGERTLRGETNDYVIEYGTGEVTFTFKRLITNNSRITIDFEYTDRQYNRTLLAGKAGTQFLKDKYSIDFSFARESDDSESPVDLQLSEADKIVLQNAGNDRLSAYRSGVDSVGPGKGNYIKVDTSVFLPASGSMIPYSLYRFNPIDSLNAIYLVSFSYVGAGLGDYNKISINHYQFVGIGAGTYQPLKLLPLPEEQTLMDINVTGKPFESLFLRGEFARSAYDRNLFSTIDNNSNGGNAYKFEARVNQPDLTIGNTNIGSIDINLTERLIEQNFNSLDRLNEVEFDRTWSSESTLGKEQLQELKVNYKPVALLSLNGLYGKLSRDRFKSTRYLTGLTFVPVDLPSLHYTFEDIRNVNDNNATFGYWLRQQANVSHTITPDISAGFKIENENRQVKNSANDSLMFGSYRFTDLGPNLSLKNIWLLNFNAEMGWRIFDSLRSNQAQPAVNTFIQHYALELNDWNTFSSRLDLTAQDIERKNITSTLEKQENTMMLRWLSKYTPFERGIESDWFYEVASGRTAKRERIFQRVAKGTGNYQYIGDVNDNKIVDEADFQLTRFDGEYISLLFPTENYIPTLDLKTSMRFRVNGSRLFQEDHSLHKVLAALSTESYVRIEEQSTERNKNSIYFLNFNKFLNENTTIAGSQLFSQDLFILEHNQSFTMRFRYSQRNGFAQFATQNEMTYAREQSIRIRWALIKEISNQIDYVIKRDNLTSNQQSNRIRNINSEMLSSDISYRPQQSLEIGMKVGLTTATNEGNDKAELNDQSLRCVYSFQEYGTAKLELIREEATVVQTDGSIPYELTSGRIAGKTWIMRIQGDYRLTQFLQATLNYEGRIEGTREPVHTGRAEVKAFF